MVKRVFVTLICLSLGVSFAEQTSICFAQENEKQTEPAVVVASAANAEQEETPSSDLEPGKAEPSRNPSRNPLNRNPQVKRFLSRTNRKLRGPETK